MSFWGDLLSLFVVSKGAEAAFSPPPAEDKPYTPPAYDPPKWESRIEPPSSSGPEL